MINPLQKTELKIGLHMDSFYIVAHCVIRKINKNIWILSCLNCYITNVICSFFPLGDMTDEELLLCCLPCFCSSLYQRLCLASYSKTWSCVHTEIWATQL